MDMDRVRIADVITTEYSDFLSFCSASGKIFISELTNVDFVAFRTSSGQSRDYAIDFNRGTLTIKRTVTEATIDGTMKIIEQDSAKTKSSLRTLPLVGSFRDYFQKVKEAQELNKKVCGNCYNYEYDGYVFVNELGERMRPNYLTEYFPKYIAKHGMPKMRFHDLRHSCASLLLANGVPLKQIQEWLGHSDFSTTANIYAHLDYRSKISSAQAMEQGMLLPRSDDFGSRWENVTEQGKITEPDLNPGF